MNERIEAPPDVAVIIAAWNAQNTLERAIRSALSQTGVTIEVIVVDDASEDDTLALALRLAESDPRLGVLSQGQNRGPAAARNLALDSVSARFFTPLDADDFMEPSRLNKLLTVARNGDWDFVGDDLLKVDEGNIEGPRKRLWTEESIGIKEIDFSAFVRGNISSQHGGRGELGFLKPLIKMAFVEKHTLRYREDMRLGEDYFLYASALTLGAKFCLTDPAGYIAVVRPDSLSGQHSTGDIGALVRSDRMLMNNADLPEDAQKALRVHYIETLKTWHWMRLIDAVKAQDAKEIVQCFLAPPQVVAALLGHLGQQIVLRSKAKLATLVLGVNKS